MINKFMQYNGNIYSLKNVLNVVRSSSLLTIYYRDTPTKSLIYCDDEESAKKVLDVIFEELSE